MAKPLTVDPGSYAVHEYGMAVQVSHELSELVAHFEEHWASKQEALKQAMADWRDLQALRVIDPEAYERVIAERRAAALAKCSAWEQLCAQAHQESAYCTCDACDGLDEEWD